MALRQISPEELMGTQSQLKEISPDELMKAPTGTTPIPIEEPKPTGQLREVTPDELMGVVPPKTTKPIIPTVPAPKIVTKFADMVGGALTRIGEATGVEPIRGAGTSITMGSKMMQEEGLGGRAAKIPGMAELTHFLSGAFPIGEAIPAETDTRRVTSGIAWLLGAGLSTAALGGALKAVGILPKAATFMKFGLPPTIAGIAARGASGTAIGGLYGGFGAMFLPKDQSKLLHIGKMAATFGTFGTAEGILEGLAAEIPAVGKILGKINRGEILSPQERTISKIVDVARQSSLGAGAGVLEPAKDWGERIRNSTLGLITFGATGLIPFGAAKAFKELPPERQADIKESMKKTDIPPEKRLADLLTVVNKVREQGGDNSYMADLLFNYGKSQINDGQEVDLSYFSEMIAHAIHDGEQNARQAWFDMEMQKKPAFTQPSADAQTAWHGEVKNITPPEQLSLFKEKHGDAWFDQVPASILTPETHGNRWYEAAPLPTVIREGGVPATITKQESELMATGIDPLRAEDDLKHQALRSLNEKFERKLEEINKSDIDINEKRKRARELFEWHNTERRNMNLFDIDIPISEKKIPVEAEPTILNNIGDIPSENIDTLLGKGDSKLTEQVKKSLVDGTATPESIMATINEKVAAALDVPENVRADATINVRNALDEIKRTIEEFKSGKLIEPNKVYQDKINRVRNLYDEVIRGITTKRKAQSEILQMTRDERGKPGSEDFLAEAGRIKNQIRQFKQVKKATLGFMGTQTAYEVMVDEAKGLYDKAKEVTPEIKGKLVDIGKHIYQVGQKLSEFVKSMKVALGDFYGKVKDFMVSIFSQVKEAYKKMPIISSEAGISPFGKLQDTIDKITGEKHKEVNIEDVTDALNKMDKPTDTVKKSMNLGMDIAKKASASKDAMSGLFSDLKGITSGLFNKLKNTPAFTDYKKIVGENLQSRWLASFKTKAFAKTGLEVFPDARVRAGLQKFVEANGDETTLRDAIKFAPQDVKAKYEAALNLTPEQRMFANQIRDYFNSKENFLQRMGWLREGQEHYIRRLIEKGHKGAEKLLAQYRSGIFKTSAGFLRQRMFETSLEGEMSGVRYKDDAIMSMTEYDRSLNEMIANRMTLKSMIETGKGTDGRPLAAVSGIGVEVPKGAEEPDAILIKPKARTSDTFDYVSYDHPAMRKWYWLTSDTDGKPIVMQGDIVLHPEIAKHFKNMTGYSALRQFAIGRGALNLVREFKGVLLAASPFHQVHVGSHAIYHKVNPFKLPEIDPNNMLLREGVSHGLNIHADDSLEMFEEGLASTGILTKIPGIGDLMRKYNNYVFADFIPRLKAKMFQDAFGRNLELYKNKLSRDQILEKTANQSNAAFGELNYKWMGRNPTVQDAMRLMLLAPDFLEARGRFLGQAIRPGGSEQSAALLRASLGMILITKTLTALLDKDNNPHWDRPMSLVVGEKEFMMRSVPGDLIHLLSNPRSFIYHRLNPTLTRTLLEGLSGRNELGQQRYVTEQVRDFFATHIPIPLQFVRGETQKNVLDSALTSMGISEYQYKTPFEREMSTYISEHAPKDAKTLDEIHTQRDKRNIFVALQNKKPEAMQMLNEAVEAGEISQYDKVKMLKDAHKAPMVLGFSKVPFEDAIDMFKKADDEERKIIIRYIPKKFTNALKHASENKRKELRVRFDEFMKEYGGK
jgi:hypothetical protein